MQATPAEDRPRPALDANTRSLILGVGTAIGIYVLLSVVLIFQGSPLGHDEAAYSLRARHLVEGMEPVFYWNAYRAPGLPFTLQLAWLLSPTEPYLRLIVAAFGVPLIGATAYIAHRMFGVRTAILSAFGLAMTPVILQSGSQVWPDVPGAALGMVAVAVYVFALDRSTASRWMLAVPVVTFLATIVRFGAVVPVGIALIGITMWRWSTALASRTLVGITAALTAFTGYLVLFVPAATGWAQIGEPISPWSSIVRLAELNDLPWYLAFENYIRFSDLLIGGTASLFLAVGMVVAAVHAARGGDRSRDVWTALGIAVATFVALSLLLHGEPRYLSPVLPWLWIVGAFGIATLARIPDRTLAVSLAVVLCLFVAVDSLRRADARNDLNAESFTRIKEAADNIDANTDNNACGVVSGYVPQVGWYSHCPTKGYDLSQVSIDSDYFGDGPVFLMLVEGGKRQPQGDLLADY
ncbi:MAG: hypothetical protein DWP92_06925, partial [Armatimonadetes bacterium]